MTTPPSAARAATPFTIRQARTTDMPTVAELLIAAYEADYAPLSRDYRQRLSKPEDRLGDDDIWLAFDSATPVATISTARAVTEGWAYCSLLGVAPSARRRGLGATMIGFALERARELGAEQLGLHSAEYMTGAHRLYGSLGFERMPERDFTVTEAEYPAIEVWGFGRTLEPLPPGPSSPADDPVR